MSGSAAPRIDVVVPTAGRDSLGELLRAIGPQPRIARIVVVDDRREPGTALPGTEALGRRVEVVRARGEGPGAARNTGWRASDAEWVAFLDDDVLPPPDWAERLADDLRGLPAEVAGSQARIEVPPPAGRPPTDWERNVAGLTTARWATADMAFRRAALADVGGFDERFPRAYREDADLALRLEARGWRLVRGERRVVHPVRPAGRWVSVRLQAGNADDVLMRALHGRAWRERAGAPAGRRPLHLAVTAAGLIGLAGAARGRRDIALAGAVAWAAGTGELAWRRIAPGPRTADEVLTMLASSAMLPAAASFHFARGLVRRRALLADMARAPRPETPDPRTAAAGRDRTAVRAIHAESPDVLPDERPDAPLEPDPAPTERPAPAPDGPADPAPGAEPDAPDDRPDAVPDAVLLDRDGTLIVDVPYNGDPERVAPVPGARPALDRLRAAGVALAVVSNQSGIARGLLTREQVDAVNRRVEELLGPIGPWAVCPHGPDDGCSCRKPAPGLVLRAAAELGVAPERCAVIGDIGADVDAARAAGARGVLVPTSHTRPEEVASASEVAPDLGTAVEILIGGAR